jgi:4-amino-4-deoxy-L-arabinose transferase-like glycosyltransferase
MLAPSDDPETAAAGASGARADYLLLLGILALAAALRFVGLDGRGTWDADQGHDMLVLRAFVVDGQVPLLGPPTSIGTFHHGALYYWLLAPAAWLSGSDPTGVTAAIAVAGLLTVAATWWLARQIGGPVAGHLAGLLTAVSPAAIEQSTFIWNPNLIPAAAALGLACAWRAWAARRPRWWIGAAVGVGIVMQCHILGAILLPPVVALLLADARRRTGSDRRAVLGAGAFGALLLALMYVPLLIHELTHDFAETRAILTWLSSGGGAGPSLAERLPVVAWRVLAWPIAGLVSDRPILAMLAALLAVLALVAGLLRARGRERTAIRWLAVTVLWSIVALTVMAPSLATIVPGLPNDHYHAFADPVVLVLIALAAARLARGVDLRDLRDRTSAPRVASAAALIGVILATEIGALPQLKAWDGGWPAAQQTADRIATLAGDRQIVLVSLPSLKSADAVRFPLERAGHLLTEGALSGNNLRRSAIVIICDPRLEPLIGAPCNGEAESTVEVIQQTNPTLIDRFVASPQRLISIYTYD